MDRLLFVGFLTVCTCSAPPPNFVVLVADDLGYGDLGSYGHPSSVTPNLDRLANEGVRFTDFYVTSPVGSPSRASLLTGRYQIRSGIYPGELSPGSIGGLSLSETTIAEVLKPLGYATAAVGNWHLGVGSDGKFLPTKQGFDQYLGIPYSHDMGPCQNLNCFPPNTKCSGDCLINTVSVPLIRNEVIIQQPVDFLDLERAYSEFATNFITESVNQSKPFFLYYSSHHPHYPQYAGPDAAGLSSRGPFGDALLELDNTIGKIRNALETTGVIDNTLVFFTSANGPSLITTSHGGNAGLLKCGKGTTYEGGVRVPAIAFWPGTISPGVTHELASTLDILPTIAHQAGAALPPGVDGVDMTDILVNQLQSQRETVIFYPTDPTEYGLFALRLGKYKVHFYTQGSDFSATPHQDCTEPLEVHNPPLIFDLEADPSESYPLSLVGNPDLETALENINSAKVVFEASMVFGASQVSRGEDTILEPCCNPGCSPKPVCCQC